jgi:cell division protein ZapA (FtsZ GTPase activity inhibitor)
MPAADRRIVKVHILDREYAFASKGEEADAHIQQVARLVDEKMREVGQGAGNTTAMQAAVLAGLEFADELLHMERDVSSVEQDISQRTNRLTESLGQLFREVEQVTTSVDSGGAEGSTND